MRNYLYYQCKDLDLAEDLTQDAFVKLWQKCKEIVFATARGFLYTVAQRLFVDQTRKAKTALNFIKGEPQRVDKEDPHYMLSTEEFRGKIENSISALPDGQREVFLMNRIDKLTYAEISRRLGISQTAVENRMSKALTKLRDQIQEFKKYNI